MGATPGSASSALPHSFSLPGRNMYPRVTKTVSSLLA